MGPSFDDLAVLKGTYARPPIYTRSWTPPRGPVRLVTDSDNSMACPRLWAPGGRVRLRHRHAGGGFADTTLDLSGNGQLTALPPEIGRLTGLQVLFLSGAQLAGLPPAWMEYYYSGGR